MSTAGTPKAAAADPVQIDQVGQAVLANMDHARSTPAWIEQTEDVG